MEDILALVQAEQGDISLCPDPQRAVRRGGHRLVDAGRTPNGLYRMRVCERCGGKILACSADDAGGEMTVWSCTPRHARANDRYWWMEI